MKYLMPLALIPFMLVSCGGSDDSPSTTTAPPLDTLVSWGDDFYGQVADTPAPDYFTQISAGADHSVALRTDGSLVSWGNDFFNQVTGTPVGNDFTQVSAGWFHSVALRTDGSLESWGDDSGNQVTDTPTGLDFTQASGGHNHSVAF